jgi:hypothetical protein
VLVVSVTSMISALLGKLAPQYHEGDEEIVSAWAVQRNAHPTQLLSRTAVPVTLRPPPTELLVGSSQMGAWSRYMSQIC